MRPCVSLHAAVCDLSCGRMQGFMRPHVNLYAAACNLSLVQIRYSAPLIVYIFPKAQVVDKRMKKINGWGRF